MRLQRPFVLLLTWMGLTMTANASAPGPGPAPQSFDVVVLHATPGGIMAAIAAARRGHSVALIDRNAHLGGLPANGLGATDIATRGATGGLFREFVHRVRQHYVETYGAESQQVNDCSNGYHFEPHVAEEIFEELLAEHPSITVFRRDQFDAAPGNVRLENRRLAQITVVDRESGERRALAGQVFIDATYEGDLAAAAGAPFRTRREGRDEYDEPLAGRVYKQWAGDVGPGSTGEGDDTIQAYNYRLCLTNRPENRVLFSKPAGYDREEYASIVADIANNHHTGAKEGPRGPIWWATNMVGLPNGKADGNNQHFAFVSTDLPEENYPWPTADWTWRDRYAQRLREYTEGLFYFVQNDNALPADFRAACREWGLAADEYGDNGHFPRQVYVREGRRIEGEHLFTAHDALPTREGGRPPLHADSITASHYAIDSHAHRKREPDRVHLDGFLSHPTKPYTVPYGVILPREVEGLLTPVPVSATHLGFGTLRMEPCWMAMGEAAGAAAAVAIERGTSPRGVDLGAVQRILLDAGAVLMYYRDAQPGDPGFKGLQLVGLKGLAPEWEANLAEPADPETVERWAEALGVEAPRGALTRGEALAAMVE